MRTLVTWLVFIHMIVNVATTSLSAAQSLYQLAHGHICFVVSIVVWIIVGCILNQIRTLKRYGWLASSAIWLNILVIFLSVGFVAHSPPNYAAAKASYGIAAGPVVKQAFATYPFYERINGVMNIVYAYGGATIFPQVRRISSQLWVASSVAKAGRAAHHIELDVIEVTNSYL
jgi:succinate dehydrogenase/fumarate reductase cytochrome b subunit